MTTADQIQAITAAIAELQRQLAALVAIQNRRT